MDEMPLPSMGSSGPQFSAISFVCSTVVSIAFSMAFLAVGIQYHDACCEKPLANWNIAFGAIGIGVAILSVVAVVASKSKAEKMAKDKADAIDVPTHGPDGSELTQMQKDAILKLMREAEVDKARATAMYKGPVGRMYASVQSVQGCYNIIMVILGSVFVWSTYPSDTCDTAAPVEGCDPFLWNWTQGWIIAYYAITGIVCCCLCCGVCLLGGAAASAGLASQDSAAREAAQKDHGPGAAGQARGSEVV